MIQNRDTVDNLKDTDIQVELANQVLGGFMKSSTFSDSLLKLITDQNSVSDTAMSNEELQIAINFTDVVEQVRKIASRMLDRL